ncbi:MAG: LL-diaminopimelate aminotransferase [Lachnospiraceae bacterium]|nr:LL-diaminopimelate aminotransferase [Lachnospiraceae bacterium]
MIKINQNYLKLRGSYLFSNIAKKVSAFTEAHPEANIIRLGIGDVTRPLTPSIIKAIHDATDEMASEQTFKGYAPDLGYSFLRETIAKNDYEARGCDIAADEIFVSDGAKCDSGNIQEIFSEDSKIAVCDPVYPVYVDTNVMAGRTGVFDEKTEQWSDVIYMPCTEATGFAPELPEKTPDIIYICSPNNPTGSAMKKADLQKWVDYANEKKAVIIFDAAYEAYISEDDVPHSIYECKGARTCAIEIRSFSKNAGFTGVRLGFTVIPKDLKDADGNSLHALWARRHGTKYNGAPYIIQKAGEAVYSEQGKAEIRGLVSYYMENAKMILDGLKEAGFSVSGGVNAPYIWLKTPDNMTSWEFFDYLLEKVNIVGTPGSGFGPSGEGYFRLTAFGSHENTKAAVERIKGLK